MSAIALPAESYQVTPSRGRAWLDAEEFGLDMTLVEDALRRPLMERMARHQAALDQLLMLRRAFAEQYGGAPKAS